MQTRRQIPGESSSCHRGKFCASLIIMEHRESIAMQRMWGVRNLRDVIERRGEYALGLLLFFVASVAAVILYSMDNYVFLYFGDAASHIVKARQIIDSWNPGIENIGTVWLPLPYLHPSSVRGDRCSVLLRHCGAGRGHPLPRGYRRVAVLDRPATHGFTFCLVPNCLHVRLEPERRLHVTHADE